MFWPTRRSNNWLLRDVNLDALFFGLWSRPGTHTDRRTPSKPARRARPWVGEGHKSVPRRSRQPLLAFAGQAPRRYYGRLRWLLRLSVSLLSTAVSVVRRSGGHRTSRRPKISHSKGSRVQFVIRPDGPLLYLRILIGYGKAVTFSIVFLARINSEHSEL